MGTKHLSIDFGVARDVRLRRPLSEGAPAVFESLLEVFSPRDLRVQINGEPGFRLERTAPERAYEETLLWFDEELVTGQVFTRCSAGATAELVSELRDRLAGVSVDTLYIGAQGALRHRPAGMETAWYGRWMITTPPALIELVDVEMQWTQDMRAFWFNLPVEGYPLTSTQLGSTQFVEDGDSEAAATNRAAIIPVIGRVPACLGLQADEVKWSLVGDAANRYKADTRDIYEVWLPRLRAAGPP
jgi:hypothetical protein